VTGLCCVLFSEFELGTRVGGELGVDSAESMSIRSWFKYEIPKYTDSDPVSGNTQLSHMTIADAHTLFAIDMLNMGMPIRVQRLAFRRIFSSK